MAIQQEESKKSGSWKVPDADIENMVQELKLEDYNMQIRQEQSRRLQSGLWSGRRTSMQRAATAPSGRRPSSAHEFSSRPHMNSVLSRPSTRGPPSRGKNENSRSQSASRKGRPKMISPARLTLVGHNSTLLDFLEAETIKAGRTESTPAMDEPSTTEAMSGADEWNEKHARITRPQSRGRPELVPPENAPKTRPGMPMMEYKRLKQRMRRASTDADGPPVNKRLLNKNRQWGPGQNRPVTAPPRNLDFLNHHPTIVKGVKNVPLKKNLNKGKFQSPTLEKKLPKPSKSHRIS